MALGAQKPFLAPKTHFGAQNGLLGQKVTFGAKSAFLGVGDPKSVSFLKAKSKVSEPGAHKVVFGSKTDFGSKIDFWAQKSKKAPKTRFLRFGDPWAPPGPEGL